MQKKMMFLLGLVTFMVLGSWAIQVRDAKGTFTQRQKEICAQHGKFVQIGDNPFVGTCICEPGYMGFFCEEKDQ